MNKLIFTCINLNIMTKFLALSKYIINTHHVSYVKILPNEFKLYMNTVDLKGNFLWFSNDEDYFEIKKDKQPQDYQVVDDWIKSMNKQKSNQYY